MGTDSFIGYSHPFLTPTHETISGIKLYQAAQETYISVCSTTSCFPYCCRTSPNIALLLHVDCIQTLQQGSRIPMRALWVLARCTLPSYANFKYVSAAQQVCTVLASTSSANFALFPPAISLLLQQMPELPTELQLMMLDFASPSLGLSLATVFIGTLPLLEMKRALDFRQRTSQVSCSRKMYVSYVTIRGQSYLSDITNKRCDGMSEISCPDHPDYAVFSMDDLGIRGVRFITRGSGSVPVEAPWYQYKELNHHPDDDILITQNVWTLKIHSNLGSQVYSRSSSRTLQSSRNVELHITGIIRSIPKYPRTSGMNTTAIVS